jgi:hypothetical protein
MQMYGGNKDIVPRILNIVTYLINALPSNGSVNNLNNKENVFYVVRAAIVAMQPRGKHASTTIEAVFSVRSMQRILKTNGATVQF